MRLRAPQTRWLLLLTACSGGPGGASSADSTDGGSPAPERIGASAWVTRASLDLRGVRPSPAELAEVAADPDHADALIASFVDDARLGERVAWIWNDSVHSAVFFRDSPYRIMNPTDEESRALGWNPLEVVREVVDEDRPFSDLVTAGSVPWNDPVASFWDQPPPGTGAEWTAITPDDGRPMAGILSVSAFWLVYDADRVNLNRRRANAVSRIFVCADFLDRQGDALDLSFASLSDLGEAARTEPACLSCHAGLDPIAAFLGGFPDRSVMQAQAELYEYSPWEAAWYRGWTAPAWYGHPGMDLRDLGAMIAADPRFAACTVKRLSTGLLGHEADADQLADWTRAFTAGGLQIRPLVAEIVASDAYRADDERTLTTEQLHSSLADLTGWDPQEDGAAAWMPLSWDREMRTLGGGTDDVQVLVRNREPGLGTQVLGLWAARTALQALDADLRRPAGERVLWTELDPDSSPDDAAVRAQLRSWYLRFLSVEPTEASVEGLYALWSAEPTPAEGGAAVIEGLVRHPRMELY